MDTSIHAISKTWTHTNQIGVKRAGMWQDPTSILTRTQVLRKSRPAIHTRKTFYFPTYIFSWTCLFSITCQSALPINLVLRWWQEKSYDNQSSVAIIQVLPLVKIFSSLNCVLNLENLEQNYLIIIMESKRNLNMCVKWQAFYVFIFFFYYY
jgi:hypothetical protein